MLSKIKFTKEQNTMIIIICIFIYVVWYLYDEFNYNSIETFNNNNRDSNEIKIDNNDWTFFDKMLYGGIGYGNICFPTHIFRVLLTILFPPLGIVIKHIKMLDDFPWIDVGDLIMNIGELIQSLLLTSFFYVPGLIYSLNQLKCAEDGNC